MRRLSIIFCLMAGALFSGPEARAHHGRDFLVLQDFYLPEMFNGVLIGGFETTKTGSEFEFGLEPQLIFGVFPRAALGVSLSFDDPMGSPWGYESVMPGFYYQITPPDSDFPIRVGFSARYQFARSVETADPSVSVERSTLSSGEQVITKVIRTVHPHGSGSSGNPDDPGAGGHVHTQIIRTVVKADGTSQTTTVNGQGSNASGGHQHSHAGSTHTHGDNAFFGTLVVEGTLTDHDKVVFNLINVLADDGAAGWGYAAGMRHQFTHSFSMSVEATGDFASNGYQEINLGAFYLPHHNVTLRAGIGMGLTPVAPDGILRAGVVWRF
jgi:hypothetical protein